MELNNPTPLALFECVSPQHFNSIKKINQLLKEYTEKIFNISTYSEYELLEKAIEDVKLINNSIDGK